MTAPARTRAVLLSNSSDERGELYAYAGAAITDAAAGRQVTFVPFALADHDAYERRAAIAFAALGLELRSAHRSNDVADTLLTAEVVMVGGGNTFRLLGRLQELGVVEALAERVRSGATTYLGASAGTSIAGPTMRTSNDMPIRLPRSFDALGLVPFQVNAHFIDPDPGSTFRGETREERLEEFLEDNDAAILGLYEGSYLRVEGAVVTIHGPSRWFDRDQTVDLADGTVIDLDRVRRPRFDVGGWSSPLAQHWTAT